MKQKTTMRYRYLVLILSCFLCSSFVLSAQERVEKRYSIFFRVGRSEIDLSYLENRHVVETMIHDIQTTLQSANFTPDSLLIYASTSPEGSLQLNKWLAKSRANTAKEFILNALPELSKADIRLESRTNDWSGLIQTFRSESTLPYHDEVLKVLTDPSIEDKEAALKSMPEVYDYIKHNLLHKMRTATVTICVIGEEDEFVATPVETADKKVTPEAEQTAENAVDQTTEQQEESSGIPSETVTENPSEPQSADETDSTDKKPFYMGIKNNMLYDMAIIPNIGVEFYLGGNFSVVANWMYSWWKSDTIAWYWRTYGGDLAVRYWFGNASRKKPLQGHHLGLYGQIITYDFEIGNKGILADKWSWTGGLEYGYSVPVAKRLNIDFTIGGGFHQGLYDEYLPIDGHYVWQATKRRVFIGPTKAEISLVWLLGRGNENEGKGGRK